MGSLKVFIHTFGVMESRRGMESRGLQRISSRMRLLMLYRSGLMEEIKLCDHDSVVMGLF